jgi:hypothetical protein
VPPIAYLLQLSAKHAVDAPHPQRSSEESAKNIIGVATAFADALDIRSVSAFEGMFQNHRTLAPYLREIVLFDGTYSLVQGRLGDVARVLERLFDWVPAGQVLPRAGCSVSQFSAITGAVAKLATFRGPGLISRVEVAGALPLQVGAIDVKRVLDACAHVPGALNDGYLLPWEHGKITHWRKPLVKHNYDYVLMDPSWCAPAFYEVLVAELRDLGLRVDHAVGPALERVVRAELRDRGVKSVGGAYKINGVSGECDVVVETAQTIILIEIKKKVLRRDAKGGDLVALLLDLSEALFAAQTQAAGHELLLYQNGQLILDDGEQKHTLVRGTRTVERVALTHLDFGSLQDRQVLSNVFEILAGARINASDPAAEKALKQLETRGQELAVLHNKLHALRPTDGTPFFNCWFLSLGHLLVMLDHVSSNEEFGKELRQTRHMSTGSLDFYFEYAQARAIRAAVP